MNITPLIETFSDMFPPSKAEITAFSQKFKERDIRKKQLVLQEGDVCKNYLFVVFGCFRLFKLDSQGKEHNLKFAVESDWVMDIGSFHSEEPSEIFIEALEQSKVWQLSKADLLDLYERFPRIDRHFRVVLENEFVQLQKRILLNISSTAEERYRDFIENNAHLLNRVSNVQIASFLGITPEFLSKIRKNLS